ncbi:MAG: 30S ribosomal protein S9 [Chloroflexota bacterium]|nr:30S ribosomal protein S9 [Chloroflexota bacterium]
MSNKEYYYATGRRKSAVARVRLFSGKGVIVVNGKPLDEVFPLERLRKAIAEPLAVSGTTDQFSVTVKVTGGGISGQAGAIRHGIARALVVSDEGMRPLMRRYGMLTRDPRVKERKKYGLIRARKAKQYSKR